MYGLIFLCSYIDGANLMKKTMLKYIPLLLYVASVC